MHQYSSSWVSFRGGGGGGGGGGGTYISAQVVHLHLHQLSTAFPYTKACETFLVYHNTLTA